MARTISTAVNVHKSFRSFLEWPSRVLILLVALVILQSCDLPSGQGGPTPTLGPDEFSLCQYLGLAASSSEAGPIQTVPATPPAQSTAFTGKYPDIEFIPLYPGATITDPDQYKDTSYGKELRPSTADDINSVVEFYKHALPENGWVPTADRIPPAVPSPAGNLGMFIWNDPAHTVPWGMTLQVSVYAAPHPKTITDRTEIYLNYQRFPAIGKGLPIYPSASNITTTCSENFVMKLSAEDEDYQVTIQNSFITQASPQQVTDYYSQVLPTYGWWQENDSSYYGTYITAPIRLHFDSHLRVRTTPADGGGTKVELTQSVSRKKESRF